MNRILFQLQLSNYTPDGKFVLTADSNWQIFCTKVLQMVKIRPDLKVDVIVPSESQCLENVDELLREHCLTDNVFPVNIPIQTNAPATRYDFSWSMIKFMLEGKIDNYSHVFINDPMLLPNYRALFHLARLKPKFILQTHFLDSPVARVVDPELSYWYGTVDACNKSDMFLWHCNSMQDVFREALEIEFKPEVVDRLMKKSDVFKDGYSINEIRKPVNLGNIRFDTSKLDGKTIIWIPNRVGGLGKSFDYTNNGKFMFDIIPKLWEQRQDFVVIAGNPNQKVSNDEIAAACPAYMKLLPGPVNRDEYRWLSRRADIVGAFYTNDTNGGLACLESLEFNSVPLFPDIYEYSVYFNESQFPTELRISPDFSNAVEVTSRLLDQFKTEDVVAATGRMRKFIRSYAAYENTTLEMMSKFGL